jgi:hypothetical protein
MFQYCIPLLLSVLLLQACNSDNKQSTKGQDSIRTDDVESSTIKDNTNTSKHFIGVISNGMKGDSLFFDISPDGKKIENLTFKGYWRCSGKLEQTTVGPEGIFNINNGLVNQALAEPPNGGSTAWRFELNATINETTAIGTFRMNINNLGCDTYKLQWTAIAE